MRIAGEIVNHGSAAADLTLSRSTGSATLRPRHKRGDRHCYVSPARPFGNIEASTDLSEDLPKKRQPTEVSSNRQPQCPSAGRASNIDWLILWVPSAAELCISVRQWPERRLHRAINRSVEKERRRPQKRSLKTFLNGTVGLAAFVEIHDSQDQGDAG